MTPKKISHNLIKQIANPVKWEQILNTFYYDENLPLDESLPEEEADVKLDRLGNEIEVQKTNQSKRRIYPDIFECGPAAQTGPILKAINYKAFKFYKHIGV